MDTIIEKTQPQTTGHIAFADALRAFAIFCVVFSHIALQYAHRFYLHGVDVMSLLSHLGEVGVAWLFSLSGFLLGREYLRNIVTGQPLQSMARFLWKRILRIYPLYVVVVVAVYIFQVTAPFGLRASIYGSFTLPDLLTHLALIQNVSHRYILSIASPMWTMAVDADFYLALPIMMAFIAYICANIARRYRVAVLACSAVLVSAGSLVFRYFVIRQSPLSTSNYSIQVQLLQSLPGYVPLFIAGMVVAVLQQQTTVRNTGRCVTSLLLALALFTMNSYLLHAEPHIPEDITDAWMLWWIIQAVFIAVPAFLSLDGLRHIQDRRILALFNSRVVKEAANLSYAVYLIHFPVLTVLYTWTGRIHSQWLSLGLTTVLVYIISGAIAYPLYRYIEAPFLKRKNRIAA